MFPRLPLQKMITNHSRISTVCKAASVGIICMRYFLLKTTFAATITTRTTSHLFHGKNIFVKRDEEGSFVGEYPVDVSGNKLRKLLHLRLMENPPKAFVSYGGPQSNSMLAIANVAAEYTKSIKYFYFLKPIPKFLRSRPNGNLQAALALGMQAIEISPEDYSEFMRAPKTSSSTPSLALELINRKIKENESYRVGNAKLDLTDICWLPQGAAMPEAEIGIEQLVDEMLDFFANTASNSSSQQKPWKVVFASGTGTMALFAAKHFSVKNTLNRTASSHGDEMPFVTGTIDVEVIAVPCVGGSQHLMEQMQSLDLVSGCHGVFPTVLKTKKDRAAESACRREMNSVSKDEVETSLEGGSDRVFGEPCVEHYRIWCQLRSQMGVEFDLIYAPIAFELLLLSFDLDKDMWKDSNILYYHCGGLEGNESQLGRYRYKGIIRDSEP